MSFRDYASVSGFRLILLLIVCTTFSFAAHGATWSRQYPRLTGDSLKWIAHGPDGTIVITGTGGDMVISTNGTDWVGRFFGVAGPITYSGERFLWAGRGVVFYSDEGPFGPFHSAALPDAISPGRNDGIVCDGNTCVIIGNLGRIHYSTNKGASWQPAMVNLPGPWADVENGAGGFVAIRGQAIYRSVNGSQWTLQTNFAANPFPSAVDITFGNGRFVVVAETGYVAVSSDGISWNLMSVADSFHPRAVGWIGSNFLAANNLGVLYSSVDGTNWTELTEEVPSTPLVIAASGERTFVAGTGGAISVATNGQSFEVINGPHDGLIEMVSYAEGVWVVASRRAALRSTNGKDWTRIPAVNNDSGLSGLAYADGRWMIYASIGLGAYVSTNAVDWEYDPDYESPLGTAVYGNGILVTGRRLLGVTGDAIAYSSDGRDWRFATVQQNPLIDVVYGHGRFVAIGADVLVSTNGMDWVDQNVVTNGLVLAITTTADGFFIFGDGSTPLGTGSFVARSGDGVNWKYEPAPGAFLLAGPRSIRRLAWGRGVYAALDIWNRVMTSRDGRQWIEQDNDGAGSTLAFGGGAFIMTGNGETIYRSQFVPPAIGPASFENGVIGFPLYTESGETNYLESTSDFVTWNPLAPIVATNDVHRVTLPATGALEFFRVR